MTSDKLHRRILVIGYWLTVIGFRAASLYLCALGAGTAHSPALNSIAKVRACACNAKRFEKFFPAFEKNFSDFQPAAGDCKDFFAVKIVEEVKYPIKKRLRLNINN